MSLTSMFTPTVPSTTKSPNPMEAWINENYQYKTRTPSNDNKLGMMARISERRTRAPTEYWKTTLGDNYLGLADLFKQSFGNKKLSTSPDYASLQAAARFKELGLSGLNDVGFNEKGQAINVLTGQPLGLKNGTQLFAEERGDTKTRFSLTPGPDGKAQLTPDTYKVGNDLLPFLVLSAPFILPSLAGSLAGGLTSAAGSIGNALGGTAAGTGAAAGTAGSLGSMYGGLSGLAAESAAAGLTGSSLGGFGSTGLSGLFGGLEGLATTGGLGTLGSLAETGIGGIPNVSMNPITQQPDFQSLLTSASESATSGPGLTLGGASGGLGSGFTLPPVTPGNAALGSSLDAGLGLTSGLGLSVPSVTASNVVLGDSLASGLFNPANSATRVLTGSGIANTPASTIPNTTTGTGMNTSLPTTPTTNFDFQGLTKSITDWLGQHQSLLNNLAGMWSGNQQYQDLSGITSKLESMYSPTGPYAQQMRKELERRDAAGGRRSQYGPREAELMAKLGDSYARTAGTLAQIYGNQGTARNTVVNNSLESIPRLFQGLNSVTDWLKGLF